MPSIFHRNKPKQAEPLHPPRNPDRNSDVDEQGRLIPPPDTMRDGSGTGMERSRKKSNRGEKDKDGKGKKKSSGEKDGEKRERVRERSISGPSKTVHFTPPSSAFGMPQGPHPPSTSTYLTPPPAPTTTTATRPPPTQPQPMLRQLSSYADPFPPPKETRSVLALFKSADETVGIEGGRKEKERVGGNGRDSMKDVDGGTRGLLSERGASGASGSSSQQPILETDRPSLSIASNDTTPRKSSSSDSPKYTFLSTRFPLLSRPTQDPHIQTTILSSRSTSNPSSLNPSSYLNPQPTRSRSSSGNPNLDGSNRLHPSGSWIGIIKEERKPKRYGYMSVETGLVVGLHEMIGAVESCVGELKSRGLNIPRLFSSQALDLSQHNITLLIESYIRTLAHSPSSSRTTTSNHLATSTSVNQSIRSSPSLLSDSPATIAWKRDLSLASPNEVGWFLRWVLGRAVRVKIERVEGMIGTGRDQKEMREREKRGLGVEDEGEYVEREERGLLEWEDYEIWRGKERADGYDRSFFEVFLKALPPSLTYVINPLFSLFSSFTAYSHQSGMTPTALSSLFGPLLFGCGPPSCAFDEAHAAFVRSAGATEHLILSYIRHQAATHDKLKGEFPGNLKNWVKGYPRMVISDREFDRGLPRKGMKVVKVERARRTVRSYSPELMRSGQTWAGEMLREKDEPWPAYERTKIPDPPLTRKRNPALPRVTDDPLKDMPILTEAHKKRLNVDTPILAPGGMGSALSSSTLSSDSSYGNLSIRTPEGSENDAFASTVDRDWRMFEGKGFDDGGRIHDKLNFDLQESVKQEVLSEKRKTMTWDDFVSPEGGFTRNTTGLDATLNFSPPLRQRVDSWSEDRDDSVKKIKKLHKEAPSQFVGWDTSPSLLPPGEGIDVIEVAFLDVFTDLLLSNGWTDFQELTHRPSSWVLMEYKALPPSQSSFTLPTAGDPRTAFLTFLFEEIVPESYQKALLAPEPKRQGFFSRVRTQKKASNESSGSGRIIRTREEAEFDAVIRRQMETRLVTLSKPVAQPSKHAPEERLSVGPSSPDRNSPISSRSGRKADARHTMNPPKSPNTESQSSSRHSAGRSGLMGRLSNRRNRDQRDTGEDALGDLIETRTTSAESGGDSGESDRMKSPTAEADKWIDILVASGAHRMDKQDTALTPKNGDQKAPRRSRSAVNLSKRKKPPPSREDLTSPALSPTPKETSTLRRHGSEKSSLRQPLFASSIALDRFPPASTDPLAPAPILPSPPMAAAHHEYEYEFSPASSRAVPEMQAVRDRSQSVEQVLGQDSFHQPAGSIHSQSALEILNAVGGGSTASGHSHDASESPSKRHQEGVTAMHEGGEVFPELGPPIAALGAPLDLPLTRRPLERPEEMSSDSEVRYDEDPPRPSADSSPGNRRDTVHSILDRYAKEPSLYGGDHRGESEDLPPIPPLPAPPTPDKSILRHLKPGFMRPEMPSQYESRDSYFTAHGGETPGLPGGGGDDSEDDEFGSAPAGRFEEPLPDLRTSDFARDTYESPDAPADPSYQPLASTARGSSDTGTFGTHFNGREVQGLGDPGATQFSPIRVGIIAPSPPQSSTSAQGPNMTGSPTPPPNRVGTLASKFEAVGRKPPGWKRQQQYVSLGRERGGDEDVNDPTGGKLGAETEYQTALENLSSLADTDGEDHELHSKSHPIQAGGETNPGDATIGEDLQPPRERYHFEPPPTLADIEAIGRRASPGRVEHGINLGFVQEEPEEEEDDYGQEDEVGYGRRGDGGGSGGGGRGEYDYSDDGPTRNRGGQVDGDDADDVYGLRDAGARQIGVGPVRKRGGDDVMGTPPRVHPEELK